MKTRILLIVMSSIFAIACGGGGGGGSSDGGSSSGVRVMHAGLDIAPLELHSSAGTKALQTTRFAETVRYAKVPNGPQTLSLLRSQTTGPVFDSVSLDYQGGGYTVLVYGSLGGSDNATALIRDGAAEQVAGSGMVRVVNGAGRAGDIFVEVAGKSTGEAELGSAGDYVAVPAGTYNFTVKEESGSVFDLGVITVNAGQSYSILVAGRDNYFISSKVFED
jgi:hypothetical protein